MSEKKQFRTVSICLTDIWDEAKKNHSALSRSKKNGKVYCNLFIGDKKELDQYGQNVFVKLNASKDMKDTPEDSIFVGNGKIFEYESNTEPLKSDDIPSTDDSDLPF